MKISLTLLLLFASVCTYAQKVKLQLNLEKDSTYYLTTHAKMDIDQLINGTHQQIATTITGKMAHKIIAVKDTTYEMELQYLNVGMHMEVGEKVIDFNSNEGKDDLLSKLMRGMMHRPFLMTMSKSGYVMAIKNLDKIYTSMFASLPPLTDEQKVQFKAQMQQAFGEKSIKGNIQDAFVIYPKAQIALKGTWVTNTTIETAFASVKTKMTYLLDNITADNYLISGNALIVSDKTKQPEYRQTNGYMMRFVDITGNATTKLKIDKKTGWITETAVTKIIKGTVQIKDTPKTPGGLTYPMTITATLTGNNL